jgi:hypothetical protein
VRAHKLLEPALGIGMGGDDQILENLLLFGLEQARIDIGPRERTFAIERDLDEPAARLPDDRHLAELCLHVLHAGLHLLDLLHHGAKILHRSPQSFSFAGSSATGAPTS